MNTAPDRPAQLLARVRSATPAVAPSNTDAPRIRAAVIALITDETDPRLVFIERAQRDDPWAGQIAFPGGRIDPIDASSQATALRELEEELGICCNDVHDVCALGAFRTLTHGVEVAAFIARWTMQSELCPEPREVADVLLPRLSALRAITPVTESINLDDRGLVSFPVYHVDGARIWGLTARILKHLLAIMGPLGS